MKKLLVWCAALIIGVAASAQDKKQDWKEMHSFHGVMSKTFHPAEEGNVAPLKENATALVQKAKEWQVRLLEDVRHNTNGKFITLTFSNEYYTEIAREIQEKTTWNIKGYNLDNAIAKLAVKRFLGRWRKEFKRSVKHWLVTEIGQNNTENIHLHGILWTDENEEKIQQK